MDDIYTFAGFELDRSAYTLSRDGKAISMEPLVFDLLVVLLQNHGQLVTRDQLVDEVWNGRFVSESTISTAVKFARKALGDTGDAQKFIKTIRGRGFSFVADVDTAAPPKAATPIALQPALYIRPVDLVTDTNSQAIGKILETRLRTVLNRIPLLRIVAPFREASDIDDPREFRRTLGVTLVLEVHLIDLGPTLQADAVLSETINGGQLWARSFEAPAGVGVSDKLLHEIISRAEPAIFSAMLTEMKGHAHDAAEPMMLKAIGLLAQKGWRKSTFEEATDILEKAIGVDQSVPLAHAHLALLRALGHRVGIIRDDPDIVSKTIASADKALELEGQDSLILGVTGCALADVGEIGRAIPLLEKAVDADPNNGHAKTALGSAYMLAKRFDEAVEMLQNGMQISPADNRLSVWGTVLALAHLARHQPDQARTAAKTACQEDDNLYMPRLALAGIELARKNVEGATNALKECLRTRPELHEEEVLCLLGPGLGEPIWKMVQAAQNPA